MKKLLFTCAAASLTAGSAFAADMAPRTYSKAPAPVIAPVANWTGCYVGGGGGYGMWNQENTGYADPGSFGEGAPLVRTRITDTVTTGGRGYFGTVQGGCDYQFALGTYNLVVGAFGDYDFANLKGNHSPPGFSVIGSQDLVAQEKMTSAWSVGGRIGWLVTPSLLTYFSAGYTEAKFDSQNYTNLNGPPFGVLQNVYTPGQTYKGYFIGAGDEYALKFLPGLFWKTEYRFSEFDTKTNPILSTINNIPTGYSEDSKKFVHTVRSELVYRFNWGGPVVAKY